MLRFYDSRTTIRVKDCLKERILLAESSARWNTEHGKLEAEQPRSENQTKLDSTPIVIDLHATTVTSTGLPDGQIKEGA